MKKKTLFIIIGLMIIIYVGLMFYTFRDSINLSSIKGDSSTREVYTINLSDISRSALHFNYVNTNINSMALQGSIAIGNKIFFATSTAGSSSTSANSEYHKYYEEDQTISLNSDLTSYMNNHLPSYKINDIAYLNGRNYFLVYSIAEEKPLSKIVYVKDRKVYTLDYDSRYNNTYFVSITYNDIKKIFYSLYNESNNILLYAHSIDIDRNIFNGNNHYLLENTNASTIISQGITSKGWLIYFLYMDKATYTNYVNIYDLRTVNKGTIKLIRKIKLTNSNESIRYEGESLFFRNNQLYVGFNNSTFNKISFFKYSLNNNTINASIKTSKGNNETLLKGTAYEKKGFGLIYYSYCRDKNGANKNCKWKSMTYNNQYQISSSIRVNTTIKTKGTSTWYLHVQDIFGNKATSNPIKVIN